MKNSIWVEKYRPSNLDLYIGNKYIKEKVTSYISEQDIPHLLFHGPAGTGKTTLAKIIEKHIKCDQLYINASDENNVETVRTKIRNFACTVGFNPLKIIILDECLDENILVTILRNSEEVQIPIKDLDENNDLVKSWNVKLDQMEWMPFKLFNKGIQEVLEIEFENNEKIICTLDHKWYVEDDNKNIKIVKASELYKYQYILSPIKLKIKSTKKLQVNHQVYDLSVNRNHNFFVGKTQTLTHNCDFMTPSAQAALRHLMEAFSATTRFILTCNYIERIIPPILSRCQVFEVIPPSQVEVAKHAAKILMAENIKFKPADIKLIVDSSYPDIRAVIQECQKNSLIGELTLDSKQLIESNYKLKILEILKDKVLSTKDKFAILRKLLSDSNVKHFQDLYTFLYNHIDDFAIGHIGQCIMILGESEYKDAFVVDKEINVATMFISLLNELNGE